MVEGPPIVDAMLAGVPVDAMLVRMVVSIVVMISDVPGPSVLAPRCRSRVATAEIVGREGANPAHYN